MASIPFHTLATMLRDHPLTIIREEASSPAAQIITLTGPVTMPNLFQLQAELRNGELPAALILDLSGVPYMDSAGMGAIVNHFVHCQNRGVKLVTVGVCDRVRELFKMTKVDTVIPCRATVEEALAAV